MTREISERYRKFDDIPNHIKVAIKKLNPGDFDLFVNKSFPELQDNSIIQTLNKKGERAESEILPLIQRLRSMFG